MMKDWEKDISSLSNITVFSSPHNGPVVVKGDAPNLKCIGIGTDGAVFQSQSAPAYVYKLYAADKYDRAKSEAAVYEVLANSPYFPTCYAAYKHFLVLSFEEGYTLYDCVVKGIHISRQVIDEVEQARTYIRSKGLNPRDIHLKNIILQNGKIKLIDVSEYNVPGNDYRWEHLKEGYEQFYHLIDGNAVPLWIVSTSQKWYNQQRWLKSFNYEEFTATLLKLFAKK